MLNKQTRKRLEQTMQRANPGLECLVGATNHFLIKQSIKLFREQGWEEVHPGHIRVLMALAGKILTISELAKCTGVTKQAMSKMIIELAQKGYVEVIKNSKDAREKQISITNVGATFLLNHKKNISKIERKVLQLVGLRKTNVLLALLGELVIKLNEFEITTKGKQNNTSIQS